MRFFSKLFCVGLSTAGLMLVTAPDAEAGHRHRHRHHRGGCCAPVSYCAPAACNTGCGAAYVAPAGCSTCTVNGGATYSAPAMVPTGPASPSDLPPPPSTNGSVPPVPAPPPAGS